MTSYSAMAARGREAALVTNTSFHLRTAVEVRAAIWPEHCDPETGARLSGGHAIWEVIGECGHRLTFWAAYPAYPRRDDEGRPAVVPAREWRVKAALERHDGNPRRYRCTGCPREAKP